MKLYYAPGACSLSPHIVLRELGMDFERERVDLSTGKTEHGVNFSEINPKHRVPALELDNGELLTEGPAIVEYLADLKPEAGLAPPHGDFQRYRLKEWLNFISSEVHQSFAPFFHPRNVPGEREAATQALQQRFDFIAASLDDRPYLLGRNFSVADAYLYTVLTWCPYAKLDLARWPVLVAYVARVAERPSTRHAREAEGLAA